MQKFSENHPWGSAAGLMPFLLEGFPMTIRIGSLAASLLGLLCSLAVVRAYAGSTCPKSEICSWSYVITMPTISGGMETTPTAQFDMTSPTAPANVVLDSYSSIGSPLPGGSFVGTAFSGAYELNVIGAITELTLEYSDSSSDLLAFDFIEPDSFWAQIGTQTFASDSAAVAYGALYFEPGGATVFGDTNVGASWNLAGADISPCSSCTLTTTENMVPVPEGGAALLYLLLGAASVGLALRFKSRQPA